MKLVSLALIAAVATLEAAPLSSQTVEQWQKAAVKKHPTLAQAGSPLNQRFLAIVAEKRKSDPAYFEQPDWPLRASDAAEEGLRAEEAVAKKTAAAEMERTAIERARTEAIAKREGEWDGEKARWVFDRLVFGDSEEVIVRKLNISKLVTARSAATARVELNSRYRWILGETKFNMDFEMKDNGLAAITFECLPERTTELGTLIHEDWERMRAAALERFGPPTKSAEYPATPKLHRGGWTVTDVWERPDRAVALGLREEESKCNAALRISDPARGVSAPHL